MIFKTKTMKNYQITEKQLKNIINERLSMQSTRRALEVYKLKRYDLNYFESAEFGQIFKDWNETKQFNFLKLTAGNVYFKKVQELIGRAAK